MTKNFDQYFWNAFFLFFFAALVLIAALILEEHMRLSISDLAFFEFPLMALATWRLTRLFIHDTIMKFFREMFWDDTKSGLMKPKDGPRRTLADLLSCPWCVSTWMAAFVIFFYLLTPYAIFPVMLLAVSAVASFLQLLSSLVGHKDELLKLECEEKTGKGK